MATFGRRPFAALCAAVLAGAFGCSSGGPDEEEEDAKPTRTAQPTAQPTTGPACAVDLPAGWADVFAEGEVEVPEGSRAVLAAVGPGAAWTVLQSTADDGRQVLLTQGEEDPQQVTEFADPEEHQLGSADFDGHWVAYDVVEGRQWDSPWTLYAWDVDTGKREVIAEAERVKGAGKAVPGPLVQALVRSGRLFWAQGTGGGSAAVYAQDLSGEGKRRTVHEGVVDTPFAAGGLLVWPQQEKPGTRLAAVSMDTLEKARLPAPIAGLRNVRYVASDGRTWAWAAGGQERLYVWREGWPEPVALVGGEDDPVAAPAVAGIDQVKVGGDLVTWRTTEAVFALDLRTRSYAQISPRYGYAQARDGGLGLAYTEGAAKSAEAADVIQVVRVADLPPLGRCE